MKYSASVKLTFLINKALLPGNLNASQLKRLFQIDRHQKIMRQKDSKEIQIMRINESFKVLINVGCTVDDACTKV